ncbi:hypothetical protein D3C71_1888610 [compost metagenome]
MAHGDRALYRSGRDTLAGHGEMHMDLGEHLGVRLGAFGGQLDTAAAHIVTAPLEDEHHVVGRTAACAGQHGLHGPGRQVQPAVGRIGGIGRAIHR